MASSATLNRRLRSQRRSAQPDAPFLTGEKVYLRGVDRRDLSAMAAWSNDHEVTRLMYMGARPANVELLEEEWAREQRDPSVAVFAVCRRQDNRFIGTTGLYGIHWIMRSGEFRIFLGDKTQWNQGLGTECAQLLILYGFEKLNLNRVWLGVNADNAAGIRAYEKAGFLREGLLRQEQYRNFRYYDVVRMGLVREDYEQLRDGAKRSGDGR